MVLKPASALILFLLSFSLSTVFAQKMDVEVVWKQVQNRPGNDTIYYDVQRKLTWKDFKGKPVPGHFAGAITSSGFGYNSYMERDSKKARLYIEVYIYFDKSRSWKKESIHSNYHLAHEQRHFDITRLGAQKFIEMLRNAGFTVSNYKNLTNNIFDRAYDQNKQLQNQYDSETRHSINIEKQMEWNEKIEKWVLALPLQK